MVRNIITMCFRIDKWRARLSVRGRGRNETNKVKIESVQSYVRYYNDLICETISKKKKNHSRRCRGEVVGLTILLSLQAYEIIRNDVYPLVVYINNFYTRTDITVWKKKKKNSADIRYDSSSTSIVNELTHRF